MGFSCLTPSDLATLVPEGDLAASVLVDLQLLQDPPIGKQPLSVSTTPVARLAMVRPCKARLISFFFICALFLSFSQYSYGCPYGPC